MERIVKPDIIGLVTDPYTPESFRAVAPHIMSETPIDVTPEIAEPVMRPLMWILDRAGTDGLQLTKAGRLRPVDVTSLMYDLGWDEGWIGKLNREEQTYPAWMVREAAMSLKLLYKRSGRLYRTPAARKIGNDPVALWFHVADLLPVEKHPGIKVAATLGMLHLLAAEIPDPSLPATPFDPIEVLESFHWGRADGQPLTEIQFAMTWGETRELLQVCGIVNFLHREADPETKRAFLRSVFTEAVPDDVSLLMPAPRRLRLCHTMSLQLDRVSPPVWRQIRIPSTFTLLQLHQAIQAAMGWEDYHLFQFEFDGERYGYPDPEFGGIHTAKNFKIKDLFTEVGQSVEYEYDFGDAWRHTITVDAIEKSTDYPTVIAGGGACPPEDCGGVHGFERFCRAMKNPTDSDDLDLRKWYGGEFDPEAFELTDANTRIKLAVRPGK